MSELNDLLRDVLRNDELRVRLKQDPESVFSRYNVTAEEKNAILNGNELEIKRLATQSRTVAGENEVYASQD